MKYSLPKDIAVRERLVQRSDDRLDKIATRIHEYRSHIGAVRRYFADRLLTVDGAKPTEHVSGVLLEGVRTRLATCVTPSNSTRDRNISFA